MRVRKTHQGLTVHGIAGTNVIMLAFNLSRASCDNLRGFAIHRTDHTADEAGWLEGMKTFKETDPGLKPGSKHSTREQPIQDFSWSDYTAKPNHQYTYRVLALKGPPTDLQPVAEASIDIATESPEGGDHDVYFNRGAAASQEYARRFGNRKPGSEGGDDDPAWDWLSRGAYDAIVDFIARATGASFGLRVCAYEFRQSGVLDALRKAHGRGAGVKILFDAGKADFPRAENRAAVRKAKIKSLCTDRIPTPSALSHNKFIVLLKGAKAEAVLTGSTNFSEGGIFGQSNVVHIVENPTVAGAYLDYWNALHDNPHRKDLAAGLSASHSVPAGKPPKGARMFFSPRQSLDALEFYARLAGAAQGALFMTFAFGMHDLFKGAYRNGKASLRYALFEKLLGPGIRKDRVQAAMAEMIALRRMPENRFAVGGRIELNAFDRWLGEELPGLNTHVKYIHTKYMLIDPLGPDPILVTGSANFSAASSDKNDENMLVIRGNARVADVYLGEFMRLWDHHAFREWATRRAAQLKRSKKTPKDIANEPWYLDSGNQWWRRYFGDTEWSKHREYFAGA